MYQVKNGIHLWYRGDDQISRPPRGAFHAEHTTDRRGHADLVDHHLPERRPCHRLSSAPAPHVGRVVCANRGAGLAEPNARMEQLVAVAANCGVAITP